MQKDLEQKPQLVHEESPCGLERPEAQTLDQLVTQDT